MRTWSTHVQLVHWNHAKVEATAGWETQSQHFLGREKSGPPEDAILSPACPVTTRACNIERKVIKQPSNNTVSTYSISDMVDWAPDLRFFGTYVEENLQWHKQQRYFFCCSTRYHQNPIISQYNTKNSSISSSTYVRYLGIITGYKLNPARWPSEACTQI